MFEEMFPKQMIGDKEGKSPSNETEKKTVRLWKQRHIEEKAEKAKEALAA